MHFKCAACGTFWVRRYEADGYGWSASERAVGADVPGRPGTTPP